MGADGLMCVLGLSKMKRVGFGYISYTGFFVVICLDRVHKRAGWAEFMFFDDTSPIVMELIFLAANVITDN